MSSRLLLEFRQAARIAGRSKSFAASVVIISAIAIAATTTIFSVVEAVLLRPSPYPDGERLVYFQNGNHSPVRFKDWNGAISTIAPMAAARVTPVGVTDGTQPEQVDAAFVTQNFFHLFGVPLLLGSFPEPERYRGQGSVVVLSHRFWQRRFHGDSTVVGRAIRVDGDPKTVVGVVAARFVEPEAVITRSTDLYMPIDLDDPDIQHPGFHILRVAGRLGEGVSLEQARSELSVVARRLAEENPAAHRNRDGAPRTIPIASLKEVQTSSVRQNLYILLGAVLLMLTLAWANVINLYLARATERRRELSLRAAMGASRAGIVRHLVMESAVLAVLSVALGVGLTYLGLAAFDVLAPGDMPFAEDVGLNPTVLAFATLLGIVTSLLFGTVPALLLPRGREYDAIRPGTAVLGDTRHTGRLRSALVVSEIGLALLLLIGSALLLGSYIRLIRVDPGFDSDRLITTSLVLGTGYDEARRTQFAARLMEEIRTLPGVVDATVGVTVPFRYPGRSRCCWSVSGFEGESPESRTLFTMIHPVGPRYFSILGARLEGEDFSEGASLQEPIPAILSSGLAVRLFPGLPALHRTFRLNDRAYQVRGIVSDLRGNGFNQEPEIELFVPYRLYGTGFDRLELLIRTSGDVGGVAGLVQKAVWSIDPDLPIERSASMRELMADSVEGPRFYAFLILSLGGIALLLAFGGVYASMQYLVRLRSRELAVRMALGAQTRHVTTLVLGHTARLTLVGLGLGWVAAGLMSRSLQAMVFGMTPTDPETYAAAGGFLLLATLVAAWLPARRAARTDPLSTLRTE